MTAQPDWDHWPWLTCHARRTEPRVAAKRGKPKRRRQHAGWVLELALMLVLALLLPKPKKRK